MKDQDGGITGLGVGDRCCTGDNGDVVNRFVRVRVRCNVAFATSVLKDDRITTENNCDRM
jgi:hypothetical protein